MASLIYSMLMSLHGYVADTNGKFTWAEPDEEVHTFFNQLERPVGTCLYGRRMYEVMSAWETLGASNQPASIRDFADIWGAAEKIVAEAIRETKSAARQDITPSIQPPSQTPSAALPGGASQLSCNRYAPAGHTER